RDGFGVGDRLAERAGARIGRRGDDQGLGLEGADVGAGRGPGEPALVRGDPADRRAGADGGAAGGPLPGRVGPAGVAQRGEDGCFANVQDDVAVRAREESVTAVRADEVVGAGEVGIIAAEFVAAVVEDDRVGQGRGGAEEEGDIRYVDPAAVA